jgi:hypothetical protein
MIQRWVEMADAEKADHLRNERIYRDSQVASLQLQINELGNVIRTLEKKLAGLFTSMRGRE